MKHICLPAFKHRPIQMPMRMNSFYSTTRVDERIIGQTDVDVGRNDVGRKMDVDLDGRKIHIGDEYNRGN